LGLPVSGWYVCSGARESKWKGKIERRKERRKVENRKR
jgi:hypothetical protein